VLERSAQAAVNVRHDSRGILGFVFEAPDESSPRRGAAHPERPSDDVPAELGVTRFIPRDAPVRRSEQRIAHGFCSGARAFRCEPFVQAAVDEAFDRESHDERLARRRRS
jgi:hypothetical protein